MSAGDVVIPLAVFRARQKDTLPRESRAEVRRALKEFAAYRDSCPVARRESGDVLPAKDSSPLSPKEVRAVRTMLAQFAKIQSYCPVARRLTQGE